MNRLTFFYDDQCGLCCQFRNWLSSQETHVQVEFLPYTSQEASRRFPELPLLHPDREIVVWADNGRWWQGSDAWLMALWATREYHSWAYRLAKPPLRPHLRNIVHQISSNRSTLSRWLQFAPQTSCTSGDCPGPQGEHLPKASGDPGVPKS